jgi:hypothetical protein
LTMCNGQSILNTMAKHESQMELERRLIGASDKSLSEIGRETDISRAMLCRVMKENRGLGADAAGQLLGYFGYRIVPAKKGRTK